jgi:hypothetical protein
MPGNNGLKQGIRQYHTGLCALLDEPDQPAPPFCGAGWVAKLSRPKHFGGTVCHEVLIEARNWTTAQRALNLVTACLYLVAGDPPLFVSEPRLVAYNATEPEFEDSATRTSFTNRFMGRAGIPTACQVAAKASRRKRWSYAITKYLFSVQLHSLPSVDLDPFRAPHFGVSPFLENHVAYGYAILAAYSALEDLGLEVRASADKPSRTGGGHWNPDVKADLEGRLTQAGINLDEPILWAIRGPVRKLDRKRIVTPLELASWARGSVRDCEIAVVDAISHTSWLRDRVVAHAFTDLTKGLNSYDVTNVQRLLRRLLLESLGFWHL